MPKSSRHAYLAALLIVTFAGCKAVHNSTEPKDALTFLRPEADRSMAVVVNDVPLAHTTQILPLDPSGRLIGADNPERQIEVVTSNLRQALMTVASGIEDVVKLNVYVRDPEIVAGVRQHLAKLFAGPRKPAVSYVVTSLPHDAVVAVDAVAICRQDRNGVSIHRSTDLFGPDDQGHVAVMPEGGKVYVSGQVAPGRIAEATSGTMQSLLATLAYMGLSASDVVQVKAFLHPMSDVETVEGIVRTYFQPGLSPPLSAVEWTGGEFLTYLSLDESDGPLPIEIEVTAARGHTPEDQPPSARRRTPGDQPAAVTTYHTPPWLSAPATYARIAEVHAGKLIYVSGLYGAPNAPPEKQLEAMYGELEGLLHEAGGDLNHLVKGTYYLTDSASNDALNEIRTEYYDPHRAPTSSKMPVRGTGIDGTTVTFDMIGVVPPKP